MKLIIVMHHNIYFFYRCWSSRGARWVSTNVMLLNAAFYSLSRLCVAPCKASASGVSCCKAFCLALLWQALKPGAHVAGELQKLALCLLMEAVQTSAVKLCSQKMFFSHTVY